MNRKLPISYREVVGADQPLLLKLFDSTREDIHAFRHTMSSQEVAKLIKMQFDLQDLHYQKYFPKADYLIIQYNKTDIGRLYIDYGPKDILIIDITISPEWRGKGIGKQIMSSIIDKGDKTNKPIVINVLKENRALHLYERLNFKVTDRVNEIYQEMKREPTNKRTLAIL